MSHFLYLSGHITRLSRMEQDYKTVALSTEIKGRKVFLHCLEPFSEFGMFILNLLREESEEVEFLRDDYKIQVGWMIYIIRADGDSFVLEAPDVETEDPVSNITRDLSTHILVQAQMNDVLAEAGTEGEMISFQDTLIIHQDAYDDSDFFLQRFEAEEEGESGWYLGIYKEDDGEEDNGEMDPDEHEVIYVYELLERKPDALKALALPAGYSAFYRDNELVSVTDEEDEEVFSAEE